MEWGTVAPSDGIYYGDYGSTGITDWKNSLLVVTLKDGNACDREVYRFKLTADGKGLAPSTLTEPNPARFFGEDQLLNGRLRDIAISPDGSKIYLINNSGAARDKITVYTYEKPTQNAIIDDELKFQIYPVPCSDYLTLDCNKTIATLSVCNILGGEMKVIVTNSGLNISTLPHGTYYLTITTETGNRLVQKIVKN